ncbi:hypothetical protein OG758_45940 [Streptomyces sp. NBC_01474]|uniref:hypothetical protein n=1 Tax=Streptomyces sp. NBC_01474 TaxID=2903880 RepID=UPI002DDB17BA|nr:hypothetical protein [Streptomyces sp. NBC_01474]WSE00866.1 hypothetical protein OG758_45940 [Streptomyces sp. NBC_01474]
MNLDDDIVHRRPGPQCAVLDVAVRQRVVGIAVYRETERLPVRWMNLQGLAEQETRIDTSRKATAARLDPKMSGRFLLDPLRSGPPRPCLDALVVPRQETPRVCRSSAQ